MVLYLSLYKHRAKNVLSGLKWNAHFYALGFIYALHVATKEKNNCPDPWIQKRTTVGKNCMYCCGIHLGYICGDTRKESVAVGILVSEFSYMVWELDCFMPSWEA